MPVPKRSGTRPFDTPPRRPNAILTPEQVLEIRRRGRGTASGWLRRLAREFRVHPTTISHVLNGRTWKYRPWPEAEE